MYRFGVQGFKHSGFVVWGIASSCFPYWLRGTLELCNSNCRIEGGVPSYITTFENPELIILEFLTVEGTYFHGKLQITQVVTYGLLVCESP